eukprot:6480326-Amphidinium_carterae.1
MSALLSGWEEWSLMVCAQAKVSLVLATFASLTQASLDLLEHHAQSLFAHVLFGYEDEKILMLTYGLPW